MTSRPPAAISAKAEALLSSGKLPSVPSMAETPIAEIRRASHEACRLASKRAVKSNGVVCADREIAGVSCMTVTPPSGRDGRQLLYLFGGGFVQGSPFEDLPIVAVLAAKTGATVIAPRYRLAPEHPFPAGLDDIAAVGRALLSANPGILLAGESAGGNLALALVHRLRREGHGVPRALAVLSPVTDLDHKDDSQIADRDPSLPAMRPVEIHAAYIGEGDARQPEISPIYGSFDPSFPPTLVTSGTRDLLLSGCVRLARVMREAGAPVDLRVWEGMWHVFEWYANIPEAEASLAEIAAFLERHF
ncbi:MAG: alpha/beta hydrolase [Pseudomonadota bacterium]